MIRRRMLSTVHHAELAMFQSALHQAASRLVGACSMVEHPAMRTVVDVAQRVIGEHEGRGEVLPKGGLVHRCAELCVRYALALAHGQHERAAIFRSYLQYLPCDPLWLESVFTYEQFRQRRLPLPYIRHAHLDDFVLAPLPDSVRVALVSDWGTGTPAAQALLEHVACLKPHVLVHLGDIYYSGTPHEVRTHFLDVLDRVFTSGRPRVYALSGNHDRYSGGEGYMMLLEELGQPASYFCLRTAHWQLLALDTGLHDQDPAMPRQRVTYLEAGEVEWLRHHLTDRRGSIILSHHPYFSWEGTGVDAQGRRPAVNPNLMLAVDPLLRSIHWWFWGHEHNLLIYEPWANLVRGRCIGAGAIPRLVGEQRNAPTADLVLPRGESAPPRVLAGTGLENDGVVDNHAFAVLDLDGDKAVARYYQIPARDLVPGRLRTGLRPCFEETARPRPKR
ncbi:metallophosphoesterase family protein [Stigmatella aurantiaca]|nr:metallophosphoesterase [Stigmatella aurantiaca]